jgi:6-phosphogluconolactonase (cycloisomerase 2 family)
MKYVNAAAFCGMVAILAGCEMQTAAVDSRVRPMHTIASGRVLQSGITPHVRLYVANRASNTVTVYPDSGNGDVFPIDIVGGSRTRLFAPSSLGFDAARRLYVLNYSSIVVYAAGARGNRAPQRTIRGNATQLSNPQALAVDPTGKVYVTNDPSSGRNITAYAAGANGNVAPVQEIFDSQSVFFIPIGIAQHNGLLYVADQGDQSINEYSDQANGPTQPVAVITGVTEPGGIAVDAQGRIYVSESSSIVVYAANASGPATPLRTISGSLSQLSIAAGLIVHNSEIAVVNYGSNSITVYPENGDGNIPPLRQIIGPDTELFGPQGIIF